MRKQVGRGKGYRFLPALILMIGLSVRVAAGGLPPDGQYAIDGALTGGSGRAQVASPAPLTIENGVARVLLTWSSPYYEAMLVDGITYAPLDTEGNAMFEILIFGDETVPVTARTVAMTRPHDIDYTLHFDFAAIEKLPKENKAPMPPETAAAGPVTAIVTAAGLFALVFSRRARGARRQKGDGRQDDK